MKMSSPRSLGSALLLVCAAWLAPAMNASAQTPAAPTPPAEIVALIEQGRQALVADKYADASSLFEQALTENGFAGLPRELQYFTFLLASYAAAGTNDNLSAHEFVAVATGFPDAEGDTWMHRAETAAAIDNWGDAGLALTAVAKKWPKELKNTEYHNWLVNRTTRELGKPQLRTQRLDLLNALFAAKYKFRYDTEPSHLWMLLAADALERKDLAHAREVARRITNSSVLVAMRIDRTYDRLTAGDPSIFDVQTAAERELKHAKKAMDENPELLNAVVNYGYALHTLGRFEEMLKLSDDIIARVEKPLEKKPPYSDLDDSLNWIYNHKATALRALGRWDEAAAVLAEWERSDRNREDKVSQAINLGFFYNELARPEEALKAVDSLDWSRGMSGYGRTQCQFVRFQAYHQLGNADKVEEIVAWMRQNQKDSMQTVQDTLLEAGDVDGAAALLISRLKDAEERAEALAEIQLYAETPRTERQKKLAELKESLLARTDVAAGIAEFGRREKFPIYSLEY